MRTELSSETIMMRTSQIVERANFKPNSDQLLSLKHTIRYYWNIDSCICWSSRCVNVMTNYLANDWKCLLQFESNVRTSVLVTDLDWLLIIYDIIVRMQVFDNVLSPIYTHANLALPYCSGNAWFTKRAWWNYYISNWSRYQTIMQLSFNSL